MPEIINPWSSSSSGNGDGDGTPTIQNPWTTPGLLTPITPTKDLTLNDFPTPSNANATNGAPSASGSADSGGNIFSNIWQNIVNGYDHAKGALQGGMEGAYGGFPQALVQSNGNPLKFLWNELQSTGQGIKNGFMNPDQQNQEFQQVKNAAFDQLPNHSGWLPKFVADTVTDPLSYVPLEKPISLAGKAIKAGSDLAGLTPYVQSAVDAIKSTKPVTAVTDALGKAFVKNYGASPELSQALQQLEGNIAGDKMAIQSHLPQLAQAHGLTPDEVRQLPEVFEARGSANPRLQQAYQELNNTLNNGIDLHDGFKIGTNAETSTMFNGKPILDPGKLIQGYYPQRYAKELNPQLQQKLDEMIQGPKNGFSTSGPFGQERQFNTVGEAEANGFNPERNAYAAIAQRLAESSKAMRTAQFLQQMLDSGVISREAAAGLKASEIKPLSSFFTVVDGKPKITNPLTDTAGSVTEGTIGRGIAPPTQRSPEVQAQLDELDRGLQNYKDHISGHVSNGIMMSDEAAKAIKGRSMVVAAQKRNIIQGDSLIPVEGGLTDKELSKQIDYLKSNYIGKEVTVDGREGKISANPFGKVTVTLPDGTKTTVDPSLIKPKVDIDAKIAEQKANAATHQSNPWSAETAASSHDDPNNFDSLVSSLEGSQQPDKIVKVNPYYVKPADEKAINEFLNPSKATGLFGVANKLNTLYNKGFLLNPLPHMHNVTTNGMYLGGAKPEYVADAFKFIKNGASNPWYEEAVRSGAVSGLRGENMMKAVNNAMAPEKGLAGKALDGFNYARHDALWDTDSAIRTALYRQAREDGLSSADAAARTNKFMVDYNNITPFERKYVQPVVPFYAWKKGNIPLQVSQMFAQTPKYAAYNDLKNAISEDLSGQPTDQKGRIMTGETLPDGSKVGIDPYSPLDEPGKIMEKGIIPWALGSINPIWREAGNQLGIGSFPVRYNSQAPLDYNVRQVVAHAINALNPLSGSAMLGEMGNMNNGVSNAVNWTADHLFGGNSVNDIQTKDKPGQTTSELITKLLGGFTGRDNPAKDARNAQYDARNKVQGTISYLKSTGQAVPKSLKKEAYRKITLPPGYQTGG